MNSRIIVAFVLAITLFAAIYVGTLVGTADYQTLSIYFVCSVILWYLVAGWKMTWQIAALFSFTGITVYQGFNIEASHLMVFMLVMASVITFFNRKNLYVPELFRRAGNRQLSFFVGLFLLYGFAHGVHTLMDPYSPFDFSISNAAKGYFATYASFVIMLWICCARFELVLKKNWVRSLAYIITFSLVVNIVLMLCLLIAGYGAENLAPHLKEDLFSTFYVPIVNMYLGRFTLRTLPWEAIFIALLLILNRDWVKRQTFTTKFLYVACIPLSLFGSVISGGRAAVILCIFFGGLALLKQKRFGFIFLGFFLSLLLIFLVNIFSEKINNDAPMIVSRPLQLVMLEKGSAYDSIQGSDYARDYAARAGLQDWRSSSRTFWFGRSIYKHLGHDYYVQLRNKVGEHEAFAEYAVRSASVHNLYGDIMLQYGLVGAILYTFAILSCMTYCINLYRYCRKTFMPEEACELAFFCAASMPVIFIIQIKGGGYLNVLYPLLIGIVRVLVSQTERERRNLASKDKKLPQEIAALAEPKLPGYNVHSAIL